MKNRDRYHISIPIEVKLEDSSSVKNGLLQNISTDGLCFSTVKYITEGRALDIKINGEDSSFQATGKVTWCKKAAKCYQVGMIFDTEKDVNDLQNVINLKYV